MGARMLGPPESTRTTTPEKRNVMRTNITRRASVLAAITVAFLLGASTADAITISDCVDAGGFVLRCGEEPVTNADKTVCPAPGRTTRIWCVGSRFYSNPDGSAMEILDPGGSSPYQGVR